MSYVLAIDVGTSFTAAATASNDQDAQSVPQSLPLGLRGTSVPSVVYYPEEGPVLVGEAAERRGLDDPGRVVREFKRRIGDSVPLVVGSLSLQAEDIFATMVHWVVDRAAEREGAPPSEIIISHPAAWGGHRTSAVLSALGATGLSNVTLISEPEAAALHYASQIRVENGSTIAVYDLGGGTFDTAILRKDGSSSFEFLGGPEGIEGLGGSDFDAAVLRHVVEHTADGFAALNAEEPGALAALARLKRECVEAKEALSADSEASISVFLPGVQQQVRLVRSEFEAMIEEPVRETVDALERSLEQLGLEPSDLTAVLLIGGSSRIPLVAQLISEQLDRPIAVDADPKSSICLGAAVAALRAAPAAVAEPAGTAAGVPVIPAPADVAAEPHGADRRASWSRKPGPAFGSLAGTAAAAAGDGARGIAVSHAHAGGPAHAVKGGAHAPRPAIRLTAVAAGAALFTILTATAAGSPDGLGSLTAMFGQPDAAAPPAGQAAPDASGAQAGGGPAAAAPGEAQQPEIGIEASAKKPAVATPATSGGIEAAASPTSRPSGSESPAAGSPAGLTSGSSAPDSSTPGSSAPGSSTPGGGAAGSTPVGTGTSSDPTEVAAPGTSGTPTTDAPATPVEPPPATTPPPTDPPATTPPVETPPATTAPVETQPATTPPPTTDPAPQTSAAPPTVSPEPSVAPAPTTVSPAPATDPTNVPAA
jgi:actin-like ATPase involved in cell morphogenesis